MSAINLSSITMEDEVPVSLKEPDWSENYCFEGYDSNSHVFYHIHMGRWWADPSIWREFILLHMPDGVTLSHYGWGVRDSTRGPSGALMDAICEEAGRNWHLRYRGPIKKISSSELMGPVQEGMQSLIDFDARFLSDTPIWDFDALRGETWATMHIEQCGRTEGTIVYDGKTIVIKGFGFRDHSRGPRDLTGFISHNWIHGEFTDGRSFALLDMLKQDSSGTPVKFSMAAIWDRGKYYEAKCECPPNPTSTSEQPGDFEFTLESQLGVMKISASVQQSMPFSSTTKMDWLNGVARGSGLFVTFVQSLAFSYEGKNGIGLGERSTLI